MEDTVSGPERDETRVRLLCYEEKNGSANGNAD